MSLPLLLLGLIALVLIIIAPVAMLLYYLDCMRKRREWWMSNGHRKLGDSNL